MDARLRLAEHVVSRAYESEWIVLNLRTGAYYELNAVGGRMLEVIGASPDTRSAARLIAEEYAQPVSTIERDLLDFCQDLLARGLIEASPTDLPPSRRV